jgi:ribosomal protein S18 acetylase RimI-like enzyme
MLYELEAQAVAMDMPSLRLGTHESLPEAVAMYRALGYAEIPPYSEDTHNQRNFAKEL